MNMYGTNIQSPADELRKVEEERIFHSLRHPKPEIVARIQQLRIIYSIDVKQYANLKRRLPYFVCGVFAPPYRCKDHFAYTETFIVDIDHIASKGLSLTSLRQRIQSDPQVMMCFASPSEDGLKVMFRLKERCYDAGLYTICYKAFIRDFSLRHDLQQVIDAKTSDVTRACFISMDPEAYFNADCDVVDFEALVDLSNPVAISDLRHTLATDTQPEKAKTKTHQPKDPDTAVMEQIRQRLNPKQAKPLEPQPVVVPAILNDLIDDIKSYIEETGLQVSEVINIQYGKKLRVSLGLKQAEVNLFYGKRGFSVVISPRRGTNSELNDLVAELLRSFIDTH